MLASGAAACALSGCVSLAQENPHACDPPGQYECPDGTEFLAKYEFEDCSFTQEKGDCIIEITGFGQKEDETCEPTEFDWKVADDETYEVSHVRVYGGNDCEDHEPDDATGGTIETDLDPGENGESADGDDSAGDPEVDVDDEEKDQSGGAISNIIFCGIANPADDDPDDDLPDDDNDPADEDPDDDPDDDPAEDDPDDDADDDIHDPSDDDPDDSGADDDPSDDDPDDDGDPVEDDPDDDDPDDEDDESAKNEKQEDGKKSDKKEK